MPAERAAARATTVGKQQRARTGCLTCRKRRRKCDERKPRCENCEAKGFSCEYRIDLSFVQAPGSTSLTPDGLSNRPAQTYSSIKFIINDVVAAPTASTSRENDNRPDTPQPESPNEVSPTNHFTVEPSFNHVSTPRQSSSPLATFGLIPHPIGEPPYGRGEHEIDLAGSLGASSVRVGDRLGNITTAPRTQRNLRTTLSKYFTDGPESAIIHHETILLRHYRYNVAPWIDVGDPGSSFGTMVMLEGKEHRSLFNAILALSACHRSLTSSRGSIDVESARKYGQAAENGLRVAKEHVNRVGTGLLILRDVFSSSPGHWSDLLSHAMSFLRLFSTTAELNGHLDEPLFWLYFRLDLANAITTSQPPHLPFPSLQNNQSLIHRHQPPQRSESLKQAFQHVLCILGSCLSLLFGTHDLSSSEWSSLWTDCLGWYNDRPVELQQIVDIRGTEVDQIDAQRTSSFPIIIYTTPLALVANEAYHIASLLLLTHKPRLLRSVAGPRGFSSPMWHSQSIAGIATANESPEQWDPILIAGLLLIAKDMTHEAQQSAVLERLAMVSATTGMNLDQEIAMLRSDWIIAGYNEGTMD